jgi:hypothetical protein
VTAALLLLGAALLPAAALGATAGFARWWTAGAAAARETFCRFSLALVPLGLAVWAAHFVFHLMTGWSSLIPVLQRSAADAIGWRLGDPSWAMPPPLASSASLLQLEILLLDAGLLLALYSGWRVATARHRQALPALLPWSLVAVALWATGVWVFLQPMEMRGMVH